MTDTKATLLLLTVCALLTSLGLTGLAHGSQGTLGVLRAFAPHVSDAEEPPETRAERLTGLAEAIEAATPDRTERAMLLALGWRESRYASDVGSGERLGDRGKAYGYWQSWETDRSGGVQGQARRAIRHLRRARNWCRRRHPDPIAGAFALYGTGKTCYTSGGASRARLARKIRRRL